MSRIIFHIDVNSAYLSWEAVYRLQHGDPLDIRTVPSVVSGNPEKRHGIILAKSIPAKKYNIQTGESLHSALQKCPTLLTIPPTYGLYMKSSKAMVAILKEYSPDVQQFSVDECFMELTHTQLLHKDPIVLAEHIRDRIKTELGFTVNIGVSTNKLLAKVASDFQKPDKVHTLYPEEIATKMWPLPVEDLFMVGGATAPKLHAMGIFTIGDLANANLDLLRGQLKSHADLIYAYAHGKENSLIRSTKYPQVKGIGNSTTISFDVTDAKTAYIYLLSLTEMVAMRLREGGFLCGLVAIHIKTNEFKTTSHQKKLTYFTDLTNDIYHEACALFDSLWDGTPIRHLGVRVTEFIPNTSRQYSLWDPPDYDSLRVLDTTIDALRVRFGAKAIMRGSFTNQPYKSIAGGVPDHQDYPLMASML